MNKDFEEIIPPPYLEGWDDFRRFWGKKLIGIFSSNFPPKTQKFAHVIVFFHEFNDKPLVIYPGLQDGGGKGTTKIYYVSLEKSTNLKLSN